MTLSGHSICTGYGGLGYGKGGGISGDGGVKGLGGTDGHVNVYIV